MPSTALPLLLDGCRRMESILDQQRGAAGGALSADLLKEKAGAVDALAKGLEAFRHETGGLKESEAAALLTAMMALRAHAAASAEFESMRVHLAETLDRLQRPDQIRTSAYTPQGSASPKASPSPSRLDKTF